MNNIKRLMLMIAILLFSSKGAFSQNAQQLEQLREDFDNGIFFFEYEDYNEALYNFMIVYKSDTANANFNYKVGMCYLNLAGFEVKSIPYFERASQNITFDYKEYSFTMKQAPLHTLFYLAKAYRMSNQLDKALDVIEEFKESPYYLEYNEKIVDSEVNTILRAKKLRETPLDIECQNMGSLINNKFANYKPVISGDEQSFVYVTAQKLYNAIYFTTKTNGNWNTPVNISSQIGSNGNYYPTGISFDGTELYLALLTPSEPGAIYYSKRVDSIWTKAIPLNKNINTKHNETHASPSADGNTLYFTSNRGGGYGGLDIYMSHKNKNGDWGKAINLGKVINTPLNEESPFVLSDDKTLFFASEGHYNMGNFDIFYSQYANKSWSNPENIGYPINNSSNNTYYMPYNNGQKGFMYKESDVNTNGKEYDIYMVEIKTPLKIQ